VKLTIEPGDDSHEMMDMLLAKKRAADRKIWLESSGDLAKVYDEHTIRCHYGTISCHI